MRPLADMTAHVAVCGWHLISPRTPASVTELRSTASAVNSGTHPVSDLAIETTASAPLQLRPLPARITLTIGDATIASGLGKSSIKNRIADGTLRSVLVCGRRLVFYDSLLEMLNRGSAG